MKSIYWRPQKTSPHVLLAIGVTSIVGLTLIYATAGHPSLTELGDEISAARLAENCMQAIKAKRQQLGHRFDPRFDPHQTGMIGEPISASTSKVANLAAKQISVNPNFAAAVVRMLSEAGVQQGDLVAVGWTGSFPALNVALCAALETLDLQPLVVGSSLSSQYGANMDDFLWLDMEKHLADSGLIGFRSRAMTVGGAADRALGDTNHEAMQVALDLHKRTGVPWLEAKRLHESVSARMALYDRSRNGDQPIAAYINVGGGIASMGGTQQAFNPLLPGVNHRIPSRRLMRDCVASRFAEQGKPVIHLGQARVLAEQYRLRTDLSQPCIPGVGEMFQERRPSRLLAGALFVTIGLLLHGFVSCDYGFRAIDCLLVAGRVRQQSAPVRSMNDGSVSQLMV